MYNQVLGLVQTAQATNEYGDTVKESPVVRSIYCKVVSIGQNEFYQAQTSGYKPEIKFVIADYYDYQGESEIVFEGVRYKVLRTYRKGTEWEITAYGGVRNVSA